MFPDDAYRPPWSEHGEYMCLSLLDVPGVVHGFSTRRGGVSQKSYRSLNLSFSGRDSRAAVEENRRRFCHALGLACSNVATLEQVHGPKVVSLDQTTSPPPRADGVITTRPGLALAVQTADCVPVLIAEPQKGVAAAVHAGWRGTRDNILGKALEAMARRTGVCIKACLVGIGPAIGQCCYEVDERVVEGFAETALPWSRFAEEGGQGRWRLDLPGINRWQALRAGVPAERVAVLNLCTACREDYFFSYRRDKETGRMMSLIALTGAG